MADGEAAPAKLAPGSAKSFSCPSCAGTVVVRAVGTSINAVCQSCGSIIDVTNDNYRLLYTAAQNVRKTNIELGKRGVLFDTEWEIIGYSVRCDETGMYEWREYLLFNPYQGFRFLVEADGHWNFVKMLREDIDAVSLDNSIWFEDRKYRLFVRGGAVVQYVMGEFFWRVKVGEKSAVADYVCAPYILSMEDNGGDIVWSHGIYVESDKIAEAFGIYEKVLGRDIVNLPVPKGISPNQPSPYGDILRGVKRAAFLIFLVLCAIQYAAYTYYNEKIVFSRHLVANYDTKGKAIIAEPIDIPGGMGNVEIRARSPVNDDWVELDISLSNDATQESDDLTLPIEYYSGVDSDGFWTEGSQSNSAVISGVPGGKYHLIIEPDASAFNSSRSVDIEVAVVRDVRIWSNFLVSLFMLCIYPAILTLRSNSFEARRWAHSDFGYQNFSYGGENE